MITVHLDPPELLQAGIVGVMREVSALARRRPNAYGARAGADTWVKHIDGACAEMAIAKWRGVFWQALAPDGVVAAMPGDVGPGVQSRSTRHPHGCLIVHPPDKDDHRFYLVICAAPDFRIIGSLLGGEAKRQEWWRTDVPHPAYFVPQSALQEVR